MGFQTQINEMARAIAGDIAGINPMSTAVRIAAEDVTVARFGWMSAASDSEVVGTSTDSGVAKPLGVILRDKISTIENWRAEASMVIPKGRNVTLVTGGDIYVEATAGATRGQKAFAQDDGAVVFGAAGASIAGAVETDFYAVSSVEAGDVVIISTHIKG